MTAGSAAFAGSPARAALLERERELAALSTVIGEVAGGQPRVVVIEGAAGIGKTRLLAEAGRLTAEVDLRQLGARGSELEREFPFGVVRQLFEPALATGGWALRGAAEAARSVFAGEGSAGADQPDDPSFASLHGLYWLTVNLSAERPLVIVVDDLHWCDRPSLRFLAYLVRRLEGLPVLVICTLRVSERIDSTLLGEITGDPLTMSIQPVPLSGPAAARLVKERLGESADEAFWTACHTATGGNPLLLHELLTTLDVEGVPPDAAHLAMVADLGPRAASRAVLVRLARLSGRAVKLGRAAAVLGDDAELSVLAALAGAEVEEAGEAVTELVRAEILHVGAPLRFVHPLVRAAVYGDMSTVEGALAHERAARVLAAGGASAERVAAHLLASPARGEEWVIETLRRAARSALGKGAAESAVTYLARALVEPPPPEHRAELLLELGRAEALTSGTAAIEHLREAYELLDDVRDRVTAAQMLARTLLLTGRSSEGASLARRAAAELSPELEDSRRALEALELMAVFIDGGDGQARRLERHRMRPVGDGIGAKMLAAVAVQEWVLSGGSCDDCADLAREALAGGELIAADSGLLGVSAVLVLALADRQEALEQWELALADAHRHGSLQSRKSVTLWRGFTLYWRGELAEAERSLQSSAEGKEWGMGAEGWLYFAAVLSAVLRERGELVAARHALERSMDAGGRSDPIRYWLHSKLELLVAERRFDEALLVAEEFAARFAHIPNPVDTPWRSPWALALHHLGRDEEARALAVRELEEARRWRAPGTLARALRVLGTLEEEDGLDHLREAIDVVAGSPARLEHAKALTAFGVALRRARRPTDAREPLRDALALADVLGAKGLAQRVRSELYAAGGRPRTTALSGVAALTASERRVAAMAAEGQTNREIAQVLFVTPKTVELHLSNAYRKLGVRSRRELPRELQTVDPTPAPQPAEEPSPVRTSRAARSPDRTAPSM